MTGSPADTAGSAGQCFAVVTGGGTAGHVLPALSVAEALVAAGHDPAEIHYVGAQRGIETELLPPTPFDHTFLDVVGFQRQMTRRNLAFAPKMARSTRAALRLLRELQPQVVVSVGGYASMPAVFAARWLRIPVVVVSFDRRPGRASQLSARFAAACAVAFPDTELPKATVTGAPVRQAILDVDRETDRSGARRELGLPADRFVVAVMGGSLGSGVLNAALADYLATHRDDEALAVRHVAGARFVDDVDQVAPTGEGVVHQVVGFEQQMPAVYAACDVLIGRGGASTVHEVAVTGTPAILVPWSGAAEDHQTGNVRWLSDDGGAVRLDESELDRLRREIDRLCADEDARRALGVAAAARGEVTRSGGLAALIERVAVTSAS
ncbi:MAG: UDP-N-acetylglucosamine--N-acetylmuramyl-(pentapeptide) pyrophosphoryl-undecaprenol N-acetylglucosamine transferase [Ilumatobacteraceae bacterium]